MSRVDKEISEEAKEIISINDNKVFDKIEELKNKIYDMIFKEENILIPLVISTFSNEDFEEIKENI